MKNFWKTVGAVLLALVLLRIITVMIFVSVAGSMGSTSKNQVTEVPENAVLNIDMSSIVIAEQTKESDPITALSGGMGTKDISIVGILDAVRALEKAATDPKIKCVYLRGDMASGISHMEEFRAALESFRTSGKPVYALVETPTNMGFYLASVADRVYMTSGHGGMNNLIGLSGQLMYYKDLLDRLGINIQLVRHGKYKSAGEPFIRSTASAENLEQQKVMIDGIWAEMASAIASKAEMSPERFNQVIDNLELTDAQSFVDLGLVDELVNLESMKGKLCAMTGVEDYKKVASIRFDDYARLTVTDNFRVRDCVAIIYADGEIIDGRDSENVAGKRFAEIIEKVRLDDSIKAVLLRVNSPGGSVIAATQIKDALDALAATKPIIASYGAYAASGGYWISACSQYIFSDATTLTGSIGVFGIIPDVGKAVKNLAHLNVYSVSSNKHSDMYGLMRALTPEELAYVQTDIEAVYAEFTSLVAQGRKMDVARVDELGQGRVWTGRDALANGLVDEIGGISRALEYTALQAGLSEYRVVSYPKPLTMMETLMASLENTPEDYLIKAAGISEGTIKALKCLTDLKAPCIYARMPYMFDVR